MMTEPDEVLIYGVERKGNELLVDATFTLVHVSPGLALLTQPSDTRKP